MDHLRSRGFPAEQDDANWDNFLAPTSIEQEPVPDLMARQNDVRASVGDTSTLNQQPLRRSSRERVQPDRLSK